MIADIAAPEGREFTDQETGRRVRQLTYGEGHSYPLYYFVPSCTADGRYLVFHSERSGWVQLYRLDLHTGEIAQLTDGRTPDAGWAIWCEWRLRGVYNHLSALDPASGDVYYFQDEEIRATNVATLQNRRVATLPAGQMPIGQSAFSPDGRWFAFIRADRQAFTAHMSGREVLTNMGLFVRFGGHQRFRETIGTVTLSILDTHTGEHHPVIADDLHIHHVLFIDNQTMLVNHPRGRNGMWTVDIHGANVSHLRPEDAPGAHGAAVVHQVVTERGLLYEAVARGDGHPPRTYVGRYDLSTGLFEEHELPLDGYVHTGNDPAGRFVFVERAGADGHELHAVQAGPDDTLETRLLRKLTNPALPQQRHHAHPFLSPDRHWIIHTDRADNGFNQIHAVNVEDLAGTSSLSPGP